MSKTLPKAPMMLLPDHLHLDSSELAVDIPVMPSEFPEEPQLIRRMRETAAEKTRSLLNELLKMERRNVVMPGSYTAVIHVLTAVLVGKSPHAFTTEFWRFYGRVEAKWSIPDTAGSQHQMEIAMTNRLEAAGISRQEGFRDYIRNGVTRSVPLPVFVRNVLVHQGTNPRNHASHEDINTAIQFLARWASE